MRIDGTDREYRETNTLKPFPQLEEFYEVAGRNILLQYYNRSISEITDYMCLYGVWILRPTITEKLLYHRLDKAKLIRRERALLERYGVDKAIEKGTVPRPLPSLPLKDLMTRLELEYQLYRQEIAIAIRQDLDVGWNSLKMLEPDRTKEELYIITSIAPQKPATTAYAMEMSFDRDEQEDYFKLSCWPLDLNTPVQCWIPVLERFIPKIYTNTAITDWKCRITYRIGRFSNLLKAKWKPEEVRAELPELVDRVELGVI